MIDLAKGLAAVAMVLALFVSTHGKSHAATGIGKSFEVLLTAK